MRAKITQPLIIVADHDEMERGLLKAILKLKGYRVIEAADGTETLDLTKEHRPDLLVIDLNLPRVSGVEAIRQIRKERSLRNIPIVAVSPDTPRLIRTGRSTVHTSRPIDCDQLDTLLDQFLRRNNNELVSSEQSDSRDIGRPSKSRLDKTNLSPL